MNRILWVPPCLLTNKEARFLAWIAAWGRSTECDPVTWTNLENRIENEPQPKPWPQTEAPAISSRRSFGFSVMSAFLICTRTRDRTNPSVSSPCTQQCQGEHRCIWLPRKQLNPSAHACLPVKGQVPEMHSSMPGHTESVVCYSGYED